MEQGHVEIQTSEGIGTVTFGHPQSNSLPEDLLRSLADAISTLDNDEHVRVIVLQSFGEKTFCAGASFDELVAISDKTSGLAFFSGFAMVINACRKSKKLIIGRIQGKAVGGGVGLAASVDYCFATATASVKLSELAVGIGPFVVGPAVQRKIGLSGMSELAIQATEWRSAAWAKQKGLYNEVYDTTEAMDEAINILAARLATSNPEAMKELKNIFWEGTEHWDQHLMDRAGISGRLVLSSFTRSAIQSFKSK
ncbi:MAG: enoyl-CoA hydratase/isomerase family protein [Flavobacteriales bacterium]